MHRLIPSEQLLAVWHLSRWAAAGNPSRLRIIELGPGRGTLMADMIRVLSQFPACRNGLLRVHLVETSPHMRDLQRSTLLGNADAKPQWDVTWHDSLEEITQVVDGPGVYTMLVAHEFFDALPINILQVRGLQNGLYTDILTMHSEM